MDENDEFKLIDICDVALFLLKHQGVKSFDTFQHGQFTVEEAAKFVNKMFDKVESESE